MQRSKICTAPVNLQCKARSNIRCGVPSVKLFHEQKWILYVIFQCSFMLHPKMFALCQNLSTIWAIVYVIYLISLILCANLCVTCGIWYVVCTVLHTTCPDPFMIYLFCYEACLKEFMLCLKIHLYASIHSLHGQK